MKELAVLTLQEALCNERPEDLFRGSSSAAHQVARRLRVPSNESLPSRTREYLLPPQLLPGPLSILIG
jgi:hypothetical protein